MPKLLAVLMVAAAATGTPIVQRATVSTDQAPQLKSTVHGRVGQNARISWWALAPGPDESGLSVYGACEPLRRHPDGKPADTPLVFRVDLGTGKVHEHFALGEMLDTGPKDNLALEVPEELESKAGKMSDIGTGWAWGTPLWAAGVAPDEVYLGSSEGAVVRYHPQRGGFQQYMLLPREQPVGIARTGDGDLYVVGRKGTVFVEDMFGPEAVARIAEGADRIRQLAAGDSRLFATTTDQQLWSLARDGDKMHVQRLLAGREVTDLQLLGHRRPPLCRVTDTAGVQWYALADDGPRPVSSPDTDITVDLSQTPQLIVHTKGRQDHGIAIDFAKAEWDRIKSLTVAPDGRVYGAGWPTAWVWSFEPQANILRRHGRDYVWYELLPLADRIFVIGYYGIKLMCFDPRQPWTFDEQTHYVRKTPWPGHASPWGSKESNPRLICRFRYFQNLSIRRPSGLALGADGRLYCGAKNPAHMFYVNGNTASMDGTRFAGALCWYDPATETIGAEREPFLHHEVVDVATVGGPYIAVISKLTPQPFEPLPDDAPAGKLSLWDTHAHRFDQELSLPTADPMYVEAGAANLVVIAAQVPESTDPAVKSLLLVFDTVTRSLTRIVELPVQIIWDTYDASDRFERDARGRIYFYGTDDQGTALCRFDSEDGTVTPIYREHGVTDFKLYVNPGAPLAFGNDRVYFGTNSLRSLPLSAILN